MSEMEAHKEPSMEEILASIRRIISEDDGGKSDDLAARAGDAAEQDVDDAIEDDEEPVELTRMVDAAGRVVDLAAGTGAAVADDERGDEAAAETAREGEDKVSSKLAVESIEASETESLTGAAEGVALVDRTVDDAAAVAPAPDDDEPASDGDSLVSSHTKKAAAASLAQVISAVAVPEPRPHPIGGERTLEAVVREALQPELRGWLDQNLAPLVERIVREEIKKLVRRVEDR